MHQKYVSLITSTPLTWQEAHSTRGTQKMKPGDSWPPCPAGAKHHKQNDRQTFYIYLNYFLLFLSVFSTRVSWSDRNLCATIFPIGPAFSSLELLDLHPPNSSHFNEASENSTLENAFLWIYHFLYKMSLLNVNSLRKCKSQLTFKKVNSTFPLNKDFNSKNVLV